MVSKVEGLLLTCDIPIMQYLHFLDSTKQRIILASLDDTHVFIKASSLPFVMERLDALYEENQYSFVQ